MHRSGCVRHKRSYIWLRYNFQINDIELCIKFSRVLAKYCSGMAGLVYPTAPRNGYHYLITASGLSTMNIATTSQPWPYLLLLCMRKKWYKRAWQTIRIQIKSSSQLISTGKELIRPLLSQNEGISRYRCTRWDINVGRSLPVITKWQHLAHPSSESRPSQFPFFRQLRTH